MLDQFDDPASRGKSLPFLQRMGCAAIGIAIVLAWRYLNSPRPVQTASAGANAPLVRDAGRIGG